MKESQDEKKPASFGAKVPTCEQVEDRIHELMDLRRPLLSDELVRQHVSECDSCAELVVDFGALNDSLSQIPLATLHRLSGLQVTDEPETRISGRVHPVSFVVCIACMLLVMLTSGVWFSPDRGRMEVATVTSAAAELASVDETPHQYVSTGPVQDLGIVGVAHKTSPPSEFINAVSLEQLSGGVEPFQGYLGMTADLPGLQSVSKSVNATYHLIRFISEKPPVEKSEEPADSPDVGCYDGAFLQLCSV